MRPDRGRFSIATVVNECGKARVEGMSRELQLEKKDGSKIWTR
ncbi:hypothetical protein ACUOA5_20215, partial [Escherichia coli]